MKNKIMSLHFFSELRGFREKEKEGESERKEKESFWEEYSAHLHCKSPNALSFFLSPFLSLFLTWDKNGGGKKYVVTSLLPQYTPHYNIQVIKLMKIKYFSCISVNQIITKITTYENNRLISVLITILVNSMFTYFFPPFSLPLSLSLS